MVEMSERFSDWEMTIESEVEEVPPLPPGTRVIDDNWRWTDDAGHEHRGDKIEATTTTVYYDCDCDLVPGPHEIMDHRVCSECGQRVEPAVRTVGAFEHPIVVGRWLRATVVLHVGHSSFTYETTDQELIHELIAEVRKMYDGDDSFKRAADLQAEFVHRSVWCTEARISE